MEEIEEETEAEETGEEDEPCEFEGQDLLIDCSPSGMNCRGFPNFGTVTVGQTVTIVVPREDSTFSYIVIPTESE